MEDFPKFFWIFLDGIVRVFSGVPSGNWRILQHLISVSLKDNQGLHGYPESPPRCPYQCHSSIWCYGLMHDLRLALLPPVTSYTPLAPRANRLVSRAGGVLACLVVFFIVDFSTYLNKYFFLIECIGFQLYYL